MKKDNLNTLFKNLEKDFDVEAPSLGHQQRFLDKHIDILFIFNLPPAFVPSSNSDPNGIFLSRIRHRMQGHQFGPITVSPDLASVKDADHPPLRALLAQPDENISRKYITANRQLIRQIR